MATSAVAVDYKSMPMHQGRPAGNRNSEIRRMQPEAEVIDIEDTECEPAVPSSVKSSSLTGCPETKRDTDLTLQDVQKIKEKFGEEMIEKFTSLRQALDKKENSTTKIEKVPYILHNNSDDFKKYYVPKKVSIGPYHHNDENLKETESLKLKFARLFMKKHALQDDVLYSKVKENIQNLREYYEADPTKGFNDNALAWMFLVDGCTILCYIYYVMGKDEKSLTAGLETKVDRLRLLKHDLLLLENQLPYEVLVLIMSCLSDNAATDMKNAIDEFIFERMKAPEEKYKPLNLQDKNPVHLLDLLRKRLLHPVKEDQNSCYNVQQLMKKMVKFISDPLDTIRDCIEHIGTAFEKSPQNGRKNLHFFRNIEELKAVGIRYKATNTISLKSVTFNCGTLRLPPFRVDKSTLSKFLNLIAYEMCPSSDRDFWICSFIVFLDTFIDRAQDVKELRDKKILQNALGSDEEVAKIFNEVSTNLMSNAKTYEKVNLAIQRRYENKLVTWIAQLNHQHFRSPWSLIAFLAAVIAITSSVVQTTYTILGYYARRS